MESEWEKFHIVNDAHEVYLNIISKIEKSHKQKIVGKKPVQYVVECSSCGEPTLLAFTGVNVKTKQLVCFNCIAKM